MGVKLVKNVILYSTGCPKCKVLKIKLDELKIEYTENNSVEDMEKLGIMSVPVLSIDGKMYDFLEAVKKLKDIK